MKRQYAAILLAFVGVACQKKTSPPAAAVHDAATSATPAEPPGPLLWEIDAGKGPVYLYGTIHTGGKEMVPAVTWEKLKGTHTFVMETDVEHIDQMSILKRGISDSGPGLDEQLGPDLWGKLKASTGMVPEASLKRFKPWLAAMVVIQSLVGQTEATDVALRDTARNAGASVEFLETVDDQLTAIEQALDLEALKQILGDLDEAKKQLGDLVAAYKAGDASKIEQITKDDKQMTPKAREIMLDARNAKWVPSIEKYLKQGHVFIAVGAGHLVGEKGVVALLRAKGYKVTRVAP